MAWKIKAKEYEHILNEEKCNLTAVAKRMGFSRQYASALVGHLGLEIKKTAIFKEARKKQA